MSKRFQSPATLSGISTKTDGSLSLRFSTQELSNEDIQTVLAFRNAFGYVLFQEQGFKDEEELKLEAIRKDTQGKSPSQRMRATIYKLWEQSGKTQVFEIYYGQMMEKMLSQLQEKIK